MREVYKINDVISCEFLKIPKAMFIMDDYRSLSSDAKLTYALLYDRLSLSKMNNWMNEKDEVFLIYTREEIAEDLGITYKKAIAAFRELTTAGLIYETRSGRGLPNKIYIVKPMVTPKKSKQYIQAENARTAESACLTSAETEEDCIDIPDEHVKNFQIGISRTAGLEVLELPNRHPNQNNINQNKKNQNENSPSVYPEKEKRKENGQMDGEPYQLDEILERCQLECFEAEERKILYDAIERLFYSQSFKIGNAVLPQNKVRSRLYELNPAILQSAMHTLHQNRDRPIKNITAYVMSVIFNCITEEYSLLHVDPYLNFLRRTDRR